MTAYCVFDNKVVHDQAAMDDYVARVPPTVEAFGGEYVVVGGPWQVVEGDWHPTFPVIITFPTIEAANAWYESDAYAPLKAQRLAAVSGDAVFMDDAGAIAHVAELDQEGADAGAA